MELNIANPNSADLAFAFGLSSRQEKNLAAKLDEFVLAKGVYYTFDAAESLSFIDSICATLAEFVHACIVHFGWLHSTYRKFWPVVFEDIGLTPQRVSELDAAYEPFRQKLGKITMAQSCAQWAGICNNRNEIFMAVLTICASNAMKGISFANVPKKHN